MIVADSQIEVDHQDLGAKANHLRRLQREGFLVPAFIAVPAPIITEIWQEQDRDFHLERLVNKAHRHLNRARYAVRSSALGEDQQHSSQAGIFHTELNIAPDDLKNALGKVLTHAEKILNGKLETMAIIIQEFIEPERSGVTFTRSPQANPLMVIESIKGRGETLVSGKMTPKRESFLWAAIPEHYQDFKKVEQLWNSPQDIEWCEANGKRYFLQTRPITTISVQQYEQIKNVEASLPQQEDFNYEKNDLSAAIPRPTKAMMELLEKIYGDQGPVHQVYQRHLVQYRPQTFWKTIAGDLYVDRAAEQQTVFPSSGFLTRWLNRWKLERLHLNDQEQLLAQLQERLTTAEEQSVATAEQMFLNDYQLIFEVNLKASKALARLQRALGKQAKHLQTLLAAAPFPEEKTFPFMALPRNVDWIGNGLDLSDESIFTATPKLPQTIPEELQHWWSELSDFRRTWFADYLQRARRFMELREIARWLTVKNINNLRKFLGEIEDVEPSWLSMPQVLTNMGPAPITNSQSVSGGKAKGILKTVETISTTDKNIILYTPLLSPGLAKFLPQLSGIMSEQGGMLSHLAILVRERNIPVIVGVHFSEIEKSLGKVFQIDGDNELWEGGVQFEPTL